GHNGNSTDSIAAGTVSMCANPQQRALAVPDIYWDLARNITFSCTGRASTGVTWDGGAVSLPSGLIPVTQTWGNEYHVCGDLTLTGNGSITGDTPTTDTVIVIENGNLIVANDANVRTVRATIILTGNNTVPSAINFPNGKGHSGTLSVSPSTSSA